MSAKIFTGFRFNTTDLLEIHEHVMEWREELRPLHRQAAAALLARETVSMIDRNALYPGTDAGKSPFMTVLKSIWDRQAEIKKTQRRDSQVDFEFTLSILPFNGSIYGQVFTEQPRWRDLWLSKPFVEDFAYWNNSDPDEAVSEEEWELRGTVWNAISDRAICGAPSMSGFTVQCTHDAIFPKLDDAMAHIPRFEARVAEWARNMTSGEEMIRLTEASEDKKPSFEFYFKAMDWLMSDEGRTALELRLEHVAKIIPREITRSMMTDDLPGPTLGVS